MDGQAADVVSHELHLANVNPGANRDAESGDRAANRSGASNRPSGTVEHRKKSVAGRLYLAPAKIVQLEPHLIVMLQQQLAPGRIAKLSELRR